MRQHLTSKEHMLSSIAHILGKSPLGISLMERPNTYLDTTSVASAVDAPSHVLVRGVDSSITTSQRSSSAAMVNENAHSHIHSAHGVSVAHYNPHHESVHHPYDPQHDDLPNLQPGPPVRDSQLSLHCSLRPFSLDLRSRVLNEPPVETQAWQILPRQQSMGREIPAATRNTSHDQDVKLLPRD